jgi:hypothetical protein
MGDTFYGLLKAAIDDGLNPDEAVELVLGNEDFLDHMRVMLAARVRMMIRQQNRAAEHRAEVAWKAGQVQTAKRELMGRSFALPDGRFVEWETATAGEHLQRASWQHNKAQAMERDARLHNVAAQVIDETGVSCLGEIESLTPWPELLEVAAGVEAG